MNLPDTSILSPATDFLKRRAIFFTMAGVTILILLLFGTIGLFVVLAIVFHVTRNIDWYSRDQN